MPSLWQSTPLQSINRAGGFFLRDGDYDSHNAVEQKANPCWCFKAMASLSESSPSPFYSLHSGIAFPLPKSSSFTSTCPECTLPLPSCFSSPHLQSSSGSPPPSLAQLHITAAERIQNTTKHHPCLTRLERLLIEIIQERQFAPQRDNTRREEPQMYHETQTPFLPFRSPWPLTLRHIIQLNVV